MAHSKRDRWRSFRGLNMRRRARRSHANAIYSRRLGLESLEDRHLLAGVVVGNNSDLVNGNTASINALMLNNGGDGISLREAILAANATSGADEITFNAALSGQVILLGGTELAISESLSIDARPLASNVIILANQLMPSRIFNVTATGDYLWGGLTLLGGRSSGFSGGGAIRSAGIGSNLTLAESIVTGNVASLGRGGGIYVRGEYSDRSHLTLITSTLSGNTGGGTAYGGGGGVYALFSDVTAIGSNISGNSTTGDVARGGGIFAHHVNLRQSTVSGNTTSGTNAVGGGIFGAEVKLYDSTVSGNSTQGTGSRGGGIYCTRAYIDESTISGNSTAGSQAHGGGIFGSARVTIAHSTITNNRALDATSQGGGVFKADLTFNHFTVVGNSIVAGNVAGGGGPDIVNDPQGSLTVDYSVIGTSVTPTGGGNNVAADDPVLGPLADNGGPTKTHAPMGGSPAIDAGDPSIVFDPNKFDQRGEPYVRVAGERIDIGAHEAQLLTLVVDSTADAEDGIHSPGNLTLREALAITNANPGPDLITFAAALSGATITLGGTELVITDSVTIDARPLAVNVTIDAGLESRIFNITGFGVTLAGLHLTRGRTTDNGSPGHGGGIRFSGFGSLFLSESTVSGNRATGTGTFGGGIYAAGNVTLMHSTITGNSALAEGGGIYAIGPVSLYESTVQLNSASSGGGVTSLGNVTITQSTINENLAMSGGGGIHATGDVTLFNSTISGNHSEGGLGPGAGGIYTNGNVSITHSTITTNRSAQTIPTAGAVLQLNAARSVSFTIDGSIVAGNAAIIGGLEIAHDDDGELAVNYSLIGTGVVPTSGGNNIVTNDPQLGPLTFNGGLTKTHAPLAGSPVLNAGDPNIVFIPDEFDQRGEPFVRVAQGRIDIGAVELQDPLPALLGDYNTNGVVDAADYVIWRKTLGSIVPTYTCADGDGDGAVDQDDCAIWRAHFGQSLPIGAGGESGDRAGWGASSAERASEEPPLSRPDPGPRDGAGGKPSETGALPAMVAASTHFGFGDRTATAQAGAHRSVAGGRSTFGSRASTGPVEAKNASTWGSYSETPNDAALVAWLASSDRKTRARQNEHRSLDEEKLAARDRLLTVTDAAEAQRLHAKLSSRATALAELEEEWFEISSELESA
ncbi:MAG TPA: choice-of-anchor Q domain-containing protein [Lacipirellulaceae bacterium]